MKNIQPFIDIGFYTVPLKGQLKRLDDGSKSTPQFEKNWKAHYQSHFNESATSIGGAITGSISNIIAIDCDDQVTYDMFHALAPENPWEFITKGKFKVDEDENITEIGGGTILFSYPTGENLPSFSIKDSIMALDFFSDDGFVYLPTDQNESKENWLQESMSELPKLLPPPPAVIALLHALHKQYSLAHKKEPETTTKPLTTKINYLAPQVELFVNKKQFMPSLFRIITPKDFRSLEEYVKHGYLHPKNVPEGRGSEYLSKVSAILGADPSINSELYTSTISIINDLWPDPIARTRLTSTIINPMVEGQASINGDQIWIYDEHWKERGLSFSNKLGEAIEVFFDDVREAYYLVNYTKDTIKSYYKDSDLFSHIETVSIAAPGRKDLKGMMPIVRTVANPIIPFGFYTVDEYTRSFNLFKQSPGLTILTDPKPYKEYYERPDTTLRYFQSLIPDDYMRNWLFRFLKRKLTTFDYSPVVLYFLGKSGSGKDTFVNLLGEIIGQPYIGKPTTKEFLEQYNGWMLDKYFIQLDEYGNQLSRLTDKQEALGKLKAYTGKETVQIRQMRTDGFNYHHSTTYIMTANTNPLMMDADDRRVALFSTPNKLMLEQWVLTKGGVSEVITQMLNEVNDFCYYLATEIDALTKDEYMEPPETINKNELIAAELSAADRIAFYLKSSMFDALAELTNEYDMPHVLRYASEGRLYEEDLFGLYTLMTDSRGTKRGLTKAMQASDFEKIPTTKEGGKVYYYYVKTLTKYTPKANGFVEQEALINIGGLD